MKNVLENLLGFIYSLSMGDYFFFIGTFLLIVLFIYIIYLIKCSDDEVKESDDLLDLEAISKDIEKNYKPPVIKLTSYEEEQENNSIISYDELVQKSKSNVSYDNNYTFDVPNLSVKKIDLNKTTDDVMEEPKLEVKLMSYEKEEEFLKTLKELQQNLSH